MILEKILNEKLSSNVIQDYSPNGMQIEGKTEIQRIVTGVTASQELIDRSINYNADALLVHHGYFWKGELEPIKGIKGKRIRTLIKHDINLYSYHLPLDIHPTLGNNVELARLLDIEIQSALEGNTSSLFMFGKFKQSIMPSILFDKIARVLNRIPLHIHPNNMNNKLIQTVGWSTGAGQDYIEKASQYNLDAFISGEISERTSHLARELNIHYFCAGHHATERYGIKALGNWLASRYNLDVQFIDVDNPA
ncbi:NIF3 [Candidatus Photodesmus katoptron Akat1]|uniref:NIF3 n=2 Tax=Candidatus Photodesmus anomalopis TaxID=28176 RepID=S3DKL6_9GAMM|nr:NIF3 [Candidatus Photodesmus katoptron Akat1]